MRRCASSVDATAKTLAELQASIERQRTATADKGETERLAARIAALESSTRTVEQKIETPGSTAADRDVRMAVLASALKDAVERGAPISRRSIRRRSRTSLGASPGSKLQQTRRAPPRPIRRWSIA